jgi:hypothetical protein
MILKTFCDESCFVHYTTPKWFFLFHFPLKPFIPSFLSLSSCHASKNGDPGMSVGLDSHLRGNDAKQRLAMSKKKY